MDNLKSYLSVYRSIENKAERFRFMLLHCFVFSLPYDITYSSAILILLAVTTFFDLSFEKVKTIPNTFFMFQVVYFLSLSGYLFSLHRSHAGFILEKQMALFIFPLLIPLAVQLNEDRIKSLLITLSASTFIAISYLFICLVWNVIFDLEVPFLSTLSSGIFFNHQFSKPLHIHAGYLSLYVALSIVFIIRHFKRNLDVFLKISMLFVLILLFMGLFFLASRNSIIAISFLLLFVMPFFRLKKRLFYFIGISVLLALSFFVLNKVPYLKERFSSEMVLDMNSNFGTNTADHFKVLEPRFDRWLAAVELIKKSPLIGYGTGDEEGMLKTGFMQKGLYISYLMEFNAHNQYLSILLKHGIIGLLIFLIAFFYYFSIAIKKRDFMYLSFLLLFTIGFLTENLLDANKGIFYFALFNCLFAYQYLGLNANSKKYS